MLTDDEIKNIEERWMLGISHKNDVPNLLAHCEVLQAELDKWRSGAWKTADGKWVSGCDLVHGDFDTYIDYNVAENVPSDQRNRCYSTYKAAEKAQKGEKNE